MHASRRAKRQGEHGEDRKRTFVPRHLQSPLTVSDYPQCSNAKIHSKLMT
jgi:hypothetical protein